MNEQLYVPPTQSATCANPHCDTVVGCRGDFCRECELQQRIMRQSLSARSLRERRDRE